MTTRFVMEAGRSERRYWADLWRYRELFYFLAWRDVLVRYKQSIVGVLWAIIRPVMTMVIMTVIFGRVAGLPTEGAAPYALMVAVGTLPWQLFVNILSASTESIVGNAGLISKVYFPRLIVPGSAAIVGLVDFLISFAILVVLLAWHRFLPDWRVVFLPAFVVLGLGAALGPGLLLTALNVRFRDVRVIIPFIVQFGLYLTPVGYSSSVIRTEFGDTAFLLYNLNPIVGVVDGFRWSVLRGHPTLHPLGVAVSVTVTAGMLWCGVKYFRKVERTFADNI